MNVEVYTGWLRTPLGADRGHGDFHFRWLRHNCGADRHPTTGERVIDSSELPQELTVTRAVVDAGKLLVTWAHDGRTSSFDLDWLAEHAYARNRRAVALPPSDVSAIEVDGRGLSHGLAVQRMIARVTARGLALLRRDPASDVQPEDETELFIRAFTDAGLSVVETHFGRIEDLRLDNTTNQNTDQLGYTDAAIDLHTDQPFIDRPPSFQALQSIRRATTGGENYLVDAFAAGRYLGSLDRRARELLGTVPVRFHRKQRAFESFVVAPILGEGPRGPLARYSYFTMAPHALPFAEMEDWYRAYDAFARLVRDPRAQYRFALQPGDLVLYDNHRMLHARTAFAGRRWVRGIYFEP